MMNPVDPICAKIGSFFKFGGVSGDQLDKVKEEKVNVIGSYDKQSVAELSLNCVSKTKGIALALFEQAANSGFSVACEEAVGSGGIIDEVLQRRAEDIAECEERIRKMGLGNRVSLETASLTKVICQDEQFINNLQEKAHRTALFIFDLEPEEGEVSDIGCKETRREKVFPDKIKYVLIPEKYRGVITENSHEYEIPLEKVIFVGDQEKAISLSYKDSEGNTPSCMMNKAIQLPDYESALEAIERESGRDLQFKPFYLHMTRLPEMD